MGWLCSVVKRCFSHRSPNRLQWYKRCKLQREGTVKEEITQLDVLRVASQCQNRQENKAHEPFCFELFRRAIVGKSGAAWGLLYQGYYALVRYWIRQFSLPTSFDIDALVSDAFSRFWRYFTPKNLAEARHKLPSILDYLHTCAVSAVQNERRKYRPDRVTVELDEGIEESYSDSIPVESEIELSELWAQIVDICQSPEEERIAYLTFASDLPPRKIVEEESDLFDSVDEVNRIKRNLINRLRRNLETNF